MFKPLCSTEIQYYEKREFLSEIDSMRGSRVLVFCSRSIKSFFCLEKFESNNDFLIYDDIMPNPTEVDIVKCIHKTASFKPDIVFAIGGGSTIDLAKAYFAFSDFEVLPNAEQILDTLEDNSYNSSRRLDFIAVPTTAGTGSELTQWATIWGKNNLKKYSIDKSCFKPDKAIIIPEVIINAPDKLVLSTAFDALSHAVEAFWAKATSHFIQKIALISINLITSNLLSFLKNREIRVAENLFGGSTFAGLAFSHTRTTAAHSMSYPLTQLYGIPHGFAVASVLPYVADYNLANSTIPNSQDLVKAFSEFGGMHNFFNEFINIQPLSLSLLNINHADLALITENAFTKSRMGNNPAEMTKEDVLEIFKQAY